MVKIFAFLDLERNGSFLDGHKLHPGFRINLLLQTWAASCRPDSNTKTKIDQAIDLFIEIKPLNGSNSFENRWMTVREEYLEWMGCQIGEVIDT